MVKENPNKHFIVVGRNAEWIHLGASTLDLVKTPSCHVGRGQLNWKGKSLWVLSLGGKQVRGDEQGIKGGNTRNPSAFHVSKKGLMSRLCRFDQLQVSFLLVVDQAFWMQNPIYVCF